MKHGEHRPTSCCVTCHGRLKAEPPSPAIAILSARMQHIESGRVSRKTIDQAEVMETRARLAHMDGWLVGRVKYDA